MSTFDVGPRSRRTDADDVSRVTNRPVAVVTFMRVGKRVKFDRRPARDFRIGVVSFFVLHSRPDGRSYLSRTSKHGIHVYGTLRKRV